MSDLFRRAALLSGTACTIQTVEQHSMLLLSSDVSALQVH